MPLQLSGRAASRTDVCLLLALLGLTVLGPLDSARAQATNDPAVASSVPAPAASTSLPSATVVTAVSGPVLPANTPIALELVDPISTKTNHHGDLFKMRVANAVKVGDVVLIPAGTSAMGEVVHAAKAGGGGKAGELILAARYVDLPQGQIKLRSGFWGSGQNQLAAANQMAITTALIAPITSFLVFAVRGKDIELPVGSPLIAKTAIDTPIAAAP